jgi:hypothetical protein
MEAQSMSVPQILEARSSLSGYQSIIPRYNTSKRLLNLRRTKAYVSLSTPMPNEWKRSKKGFALRQIVIAHIRAELGVVRCRSFRSMNMRTVTEPAPHPDRILDEPEAAKAIAPAA